MENGGIGWKEESVVDVCAGCAWCWDVSDVAFICRNLSPKKILRDRNTGTRMLCSGVKLGTPQPYPGKT